MSIKVSITDGRGNKESITSAKNIAANTKLGVEKALFFIGKDLKGEFNKQVLARNKTGRVYFRRIKGGVKRRYVASAAGQTPANITGNYRKSIGTKISGDELAFGNSAKYAGFLEFGTSRMKPRKGLDNSIKAKERNIIRTLAGEIEERI